MLALAGSAGALPHDHRHRHVGHAVLDPLLERRPDEVVGAKRTNFGDAPCTRLAETGCELIKDRPENVACHEYYEIYPVTGKAVICRKAAFSRSNISTRESSFFASRVTRRCQIL